ncbi:unnamed protein product [Ceutorhynchus assimilis]|uniref:Mitochondrial import receptor subunit TOM70 n=1 Tax=Ceutorhynchus assimilis TaxID=467358 RepID=A0A9N9MMZ4_9CUCU|nr:unnamed protein product [Ceutorhynchus assimilis]
MPRGGSGFGLSSLRWQIALGLGAVGAIGLTYWYMKSSKKQTLVPVEENAKLTEETPFQKAQRYKTEGNASFRRGKYDQAIASYNQAIEIIPEEYKFDLATFYQNRAAAYEQLQKWTTVITDCDRAIQLNNKYEKALSRRAKAHEMVKDYESALDDITAVCLLQNFGSQNSLLMADRVLKELGKKNASEAMKTRVPLIPSKNFVRTYFASFSQDPVHTKLLETTDPLGQGELKGFLKAKLAFATEKYEEVIPACTEELNLSESESNFKIEALSLRGSFYFLTGQFKEALEDLTSIIDSEQADVNIKVNALIKRASIYMQTEKLSECLNDFNKAIALGPDISDVYHHRGQVMLLTEEQNEAARKDFEMAVKLNPNFPIAVIQKCFTDYRFASQVHDVSTLMKSIEDFRSAITKFPSCSETYIMFAQVQTERQEFQHAEELYQKAMKVDPTNASVYVHRGLLLLQWKGEIENAVQLMRQAISIDEKCEFAFETLGTVEVQRGNLVIAIDLFNKAIALARSEMEMVHLFSLRDAASSQLKIAAKLNIGPQLMKGLS